MICTKCNSIIPDESKFCPTCGAGCAPSTKRCSNCGLELEMNAKFCPVCGTAATTVSLEKQPDSESLVSSMPNSVPAPAAVVTATPTGFGNPAPMPQYAPPADAASTGFGNPAPMPQYAPSMDAVSAAAVPAKKKKGAKIAIIIVAAVVVLLGAAAAFFFTNKAAFLSTFMGKSRYAAMIEGNSVKEIAGKIDASAISNGAKALSQYYVTALSSGGPVSGSVLPTSNTADGITVAKSISTSPYSVTDFKSLIEMYSKVLSETYGVDAIKVTANANINLTDSAISAISDSSVSDASEVNKIIDAINGTTFTYDLAANDSAVGMYFNADGKIAVNAKVIMTDDGTCYLSLPFASGKALMFKLESASSVNTTASTSTAVLELDEKEITRLIEDIIKIYLKHYEKSVTEMENGSLTINGEEISGKLITANFNGEIISAMLKDIINYIGEDKYFSTQIVDFVNKNGGSITVNQYQMMFSTVANVITIPDSVGFSIKTVIDKNGDILAKSYTAGPNDDIEFTYKNSDKSFNAQLIAKENGNKFTANLSCVETDAKSGTAELSFQKNNDGEYKITVSYSGAETVKSFNQDVPVGTYTISVDMPQGFESADNEFLTVLDGLKITVSSSATADSQTIDLNVKTSAYGDVSLTLTANKSSPDETLAIPGDVIDLSGAMNGNIDSNTEKKLEDFSKEVTDALKNIDFFKNLVGDIESGLPDTPDTPNTPNTPTTPGISHANDDFSSMSFDEASAIFNEYISRMYDLTFLTVNDPEFESKLDDANSAYNAAHSYWFDYCYEDNYNNEETLNGFKNSLHDFVIAIEECEALVN